MDREGIMTNQSLPMIKSHCYLLKIIDIEVDPFYRE
jgi:hypothetical protein